MLFGIDIDFEDALFGAVFMAGAAVTAGIIDLTVLGVAMSDPIMTVEGTDITWAFGAAIVALVGAYLTNRVNSSPNKQYEVDRDLDAIVKGDATLETYVVIGTIGSVLVLGLDILGAQQIVQSSYLYGAPVMLVQTAGYYVVSYLN